ncbi:helix-turn-helix domain-containing protein [Humibacter sp.]|uniref:helix-turn-helix domain-containing protein n=1 Tax=Humibacter sp. TaxID=1940291 RepID=UPI003F809F7B
MTRLLHPIPEVAQVLGGMSRSTIYELFDSGALKRVKVGTRVYVTHEELERFVASLSAISA